MHNMRIWNSRSWPLRPKFVGTLFQHQSVSETALTKSGSGFLLFIWSNIKLLDGLTAAIAVIDAIAYGIVEAWANYKAFDLNSERQRIQLGYWNSCSSRLEIRCDWKYQRNVSSPLRCGSGVSYGSDDEWATYEALDRNSQRQRIQLALGNVWWMEVSQEGQFASLQWQWCHLRDCWGLRHV